MSDFEGLKSEVGSGASAEAESPVTVRQAQCGVPSSGDGHGTVRDTGQLRQVRIRDSAMTGGG
jgi:hypothetical protein